MASSRERNADEVEGPKRISDALSGLFFAGDARNILRWFGFFDSSVYATVYLGFMAVFLFGIAVVLLSFDLCEEFERQDKWFAVYCVGTLLLLLISNAVSKLTFTHTGNKFADKLLSFMRIDDLSYVVAAQNIRVLVGTFGFFVVLLKVSVEIFRLSPKGSPFSTVCIIAFWIYMILSSVITNGLVYMAAISCKLHTIIFKNCLNEPGNCPLTLLQHYTRLRNFLMNFSQQFWWYFGCQALMCQLSGGLVWGLMLEGKRRQGNLMLGATDFLCHLIVEMLMFWGIRCVVNDITSDLEMILSVIHERAELLSLASTNVELVSKWERIDSYVSFNSKEVLRFYSYTRAAYLCRGMLPLGIATISTLGKSIVSALCEAIVSLVDDLSSINLGFIDREDDCILAIMVAEWYLLTEI